MKREILDHAVSVVEARQREIALQIACLRKEAEELSIALRVIERLSGEDASQTSIDAAAVRQ